MQRLCILLLLLCSTASFAQLTPLANSIQSPSTKTIVTGQVMTPIDFTVQLEYFDNPLNHPVTLETRLAQENKFLFAYDTSIPRVVNLKHGSQKVPMFIEPYSNTQIAFDGSNLLHGVSFTGSGANNNIYLKQLVIDEKNGLSKKQLIDLPAYDVLIDKAVVNLMTKDPEVFVRKLNKHTDDQHQQLERYHQRYPLTPAFLALQHRNIEYTQMIHQLHYVVVNQNKYSYLPNGYFSFLDKLDIHNEQELLNNETFKWLAHAYGNYLFSQTKPAFNFSIVDIFDALNNSMTNSELKSFLLTSLFVDDIQSKNFVLADARKKQFYHQNKSKLFANTVEKTYNESLRLEPGKPAPNFLVTTMDNPNEVVSLYDLEGKTVFLSFWSSTCGNCIRNFKRTHELKKQFQRKGVVFVNIALDPDKAACQALINKFNISGTHLIAPEKYSDVKLAYNVFLLPSYFVIDKQGNITTLKGSPLDSIAPQLEEMLY